MKRIGYSVLALTVAVAASSTAANGKPGNTYGQNPKSAFMRVYGEALPPIGHVGFCRRHPRECLSLVSGNARIRLTAKRRHELKTVNDMVNRIVRPVSDQDLYGRLEHWTYPAGQGDCEDYVLLKSRLLVERGWPKSALLITVVRDENFEGHAVLTVRTSQGDFVLDNKRSDVRSWNKTPYTFVKRQSYRNPRIWMSLAPPSVSRAANFSSTRSR